MLGEFFAHQIFSNLFGNTFYLLVILSRSFFFHYDVDVLTELHWTVLTLIIGLSFSDEINQNTVSYNANSAIAMQRHGTLVVCLERWPVNLVKTFKILSRSVY